jgi:hypothetical protein
LVTDSSVAWFLRQPAPTSGEIEGGVAAAGVDGDAGSGDNGDEHNSDDIGDGDSGGNNGDSVNGDSGDSEDAYAPLIALLANEIAARNPDRVAFFGFCRGGYGNVLFYFLLLLCCSPTLMKRRAS